MSYCNVCKIYVNHSNEQNCIRIFQAKSCNSLDTLEFKTSLSIWYNSVLCEFVFFFAPKIMNVFLLLRNESALSTCSALIFNSFMWNRTFVGNSKKPPEIQIQIQIQLHNWRFRAMITEQLNKVDTQKNEPSSLQ